MHVRGSAPRGPFNLLVQGQCRILFLNHPKAQIGMRWKKGKCMCFYCVWEGGQAVKDGVFQKLGRMAETTHFLAKLESYVQSERTNHRPNYGRLERNRSLGELE
jgi:hypothetical protein